jgi:hypothetical protein
VEGVKEKFRETIRELYAGGEDKILVMNNRTFQYLLRQNDLMEERQPKETGPSISMKIDDSFEDGVMLPESPPKISKRSKRRRHTERK